MSYKGENSYLDLAKVVWNKVFPFHDYNAVAVKTPQVLAIKRIDAAQADLLFSNKDLMPMVFFLQFIGVPVYSKDINLTMTYAGLFRKVFKSMIGLDKNDSPMLNVARGTGLILLNMIRMPVSLVINTVRLFTEFLPLVLARFADETAYLLLNYYDENKNNNENKPLAIAALVVGSLFRGLDYLFTGIWLLGRAITSPADSMRAAWNYGKERDSKLLGIVLMSISALITTAAYVVVFPVGLKLLALNFPQIISLISQSSFLLTAGNYIGTALNPLWQLLGMGFSGASVMAATMFAGLAALATGAKALYDDFTFEKQELEDRKQRGIGINNGSANNSESNPVIHGNEKLQPSPQIVSSATEREESMNVVAKAFQFLSSLLKSIVKSSERVSEPERESLNSENSHHLHINL